MTHHEAKIVLVRPRDPNNMGAAARAMKNFGLTELALVAPFAPHWNEAVSAVHAEEVLKGAQVFETLAEAIADCTFVIGTADHRRVGTPLYTPTDLRAEIVPPPGKVALVFGSEKHGLTNEDLAFCHRTLSIPTVADCPSMNLGQAVAICCYELTRTEKTAAPKPQVYAAVGEVEAGLQALLHVLREAEFLTSINEPAMTQKLRQRLLNCHFTSYDVAMLRGALRQILWRFENK